MFTAARGIGAFLNGERLRVQPKAASLSESTVCYVLTFATRHTPLGKHVMAHLYADTRRVLNTWAPALDWAMLSCGVADELVYLTEEPLASDPGMLAGLFLFQQAGGFIADLTGKSVREEAPLHSIIAATSETRLGEIAQSINVESLRSDG
jgi:fructose-1,6-bisphosphatase/inositol monophosphatase family enzyme